MQEFYQLLADKLEEDAVGRDDVLQDFPEWDSLTALSIVAMIEEKYGVEVSAVDLLDIESAGDLEDLVRARIGVNA